MAEKSSANVEYWNKYSNLYEELSTPAHTHFSLDALALAKEFLTDTSAKVFLLDVAAGTGLFAIAAAQEYPNGNVLATDVSEAQLDAAKRKIDELGGLSNLECRVMDGQALELEDNSVDVLVCLFGMMFFEDRDKGWREFQRVLKPGGAAIISTWHALGIVPPLEEARARTLGLASTEEYPGFDRGRSMRDHDKLREQALAAGFASVEVKPHTYVSKTFHQSQVKTMVDKWLAFPTFEASIPEGKEEQYKAEVASVLLRNVDEEGMIGISNQAIFTVAKK